MIEIYEVYFNSFGDILYKAYFKTEEGAKEFMQYINKKYMYDLDETNWKINKIKVYDNVLQYMNG